MIAFQGKVYFTQRKLFEKQTTLKIRKYSNQGSLIIFCGFKYAKNIQKLLINHYNPIEKYRLIYHDNYIYPIL